MANFTHEHDYMWNGKTKTATQKSGKMFAIQFSGAGKMLTALDELSAAGVQRAIGKALRETHAGVTPKIHAEMQKHNKSGDVERSIVDEPRVTIEGNIISMPIGFDLDKGGLPSIWLIYGTPRHGPYGEKGGHPGQQPDQGLYEAIFGRKTAGEIAKVQRKAIKEVMEQYLNGG